MRRLLRRVCFFIVLGIWAGGCAGAGSSAEDLVEIEALADLDASNLDLATDDDQAGVDATDVEDGALDGGDLDATDVDEASFGGVGAAQEGTLLWLENDQIRVEVDTVSGLYLVRTLSGRLLLAQAESRLTLQEVAGGLPGEGAGEQLSTGSAQFMDWSFEEVDDSLGTGLRVTTRWSLPSHPADVLEVSMGLRGGAGFWLCRVGLVVGEGSDLVDKKLMSLSPVVADEKLSGALYLGTDPSKHAILDDGTDMYFDFVARIFKVGAGDSLLFPPGSVANWNMALYDPDTLESLVAGFLTFKEGMGLVAIDYDAALTWEEDKRSSFTRFEGFVLNDPATTLKVGTVNSGLFYIDFLPESVFQGLEDYATRYAAHAGKTLWTDIPTSWNSWNGGNGEGGLGTEINEAIILENLDAMEEDFAPFGMDWFVIDNGWEVDLGDWETNAQRFPDHDGMEGMHWLAQEIKGRGLRPGIWVAPFWVHKDSKLALEHPDWIAQTNDFSGFLLGDEDATLDLTHPEVLQWTHDLFHKLTAEWGYEWIKLDFSYYALFATNLYDPSMSASQAYWNALDVIRDAIGPDTFLMDIAATGLGFDAADGGRTTLDNMPNFEDLDGQGIKVTLRTASHRYYLNWLWANHPDLVYYRPTIGLTLNEARAWTSVVSLMGGIIKMGDPFTMLHEHPDWLDMARMIIPGNPHSARPLDMFERLHPELWDLEMERNGASWHVVGLYNWGQNENPVTGESFPEETRTATVPLTRLGLDPSKRTLLFSAWDQTCRFVEDGVIEETLEPRTDRVLVVREEPQNPTLVFTSRHLLGTAVEVLSETSLSTEDGITLVADVDNPPGHAVTVYIATGGLLPGTITSPAEAEWGESPCAGVAALLFTPNEPITTVEVRFE